MRHWACQMVRGLPSLIFRGGNPFNTRKTNDPIDCTRSKARKLADLIEAWEPPDHWFSGIGKSEERRFSSLSCVTARGFALADITGAPAPSS